MNSTLQCHICGSKNIDLFESFSLLSRATSDCKPWTKGGKLCACADCGIVQKVIDDKWRAEVREIYDNYDLYHQSPENKEQPIFNSITGQSTPRSMAVIDYTRQIVQIPENIEVIDIGCGVGNMLKSLGNTFTSARLYGFEPNMHKKQHLMQIKNVAEVYTDTTEFNTKKFDMITMIHVLEHIDAPIPVLKNLKANLKDYGYLVIAVPDYIANPFDLIIADHSTHFSKQTLNSLLIKCGFEVISISDKVINKEIIVVCRIAETEMQPPKATYDSSMIQTRLDWMSAIIDQANEIAAQRPFGIFGTSIAANWIYGALADKVDFFVDEDQDRVNHLYHNKPVFHSSKIPANSHTYVCLQPNVVGKVIARISSDEYALYPTPDFA